MLLLVAFVEFPSTSFSDVLVQASWSLDACAESRGEEGGIRTVVYRKPTHTDQYLQFSSNHHLNHKRSVVRTLQNRAKTIITDEIDQKKELEHVSNVLTDNGYAKWMLKPTQIIQYPSFPNCAT